MNPYFSKAPVWLDPTDAILALDQKHVHIRRDTDSDLWLLEVEEADSKGSLAGRCAVRATHTGTSPTMRTVLSETESPAEPTTWNDTEYLLQEALDMLTPDAESAMAPLTLTLPDSD